MAVVDNETIDSYLIQMDIPAEILRDGIWLVDDQSDEVPPIIISHEPPIIYIRLKVMDVPTTGREAIFQKLLEYNSNGIAFGAYCIEDGEVLLIDTLRSESVDMNELRASIESLLLAAQEHYHELVGLMEPVS